MKSYGKNGIWCLLSYYTVCPEAPDGSGRVLWAGADTKKGEASVFITFPDGEIKQFGQVKTDSTFWHTGLWQSWSYDMKYVYYQSGESYEKPSVTRHDLATDAEVTIEGADMEGAPTGSAPVTSGLLGMLYAAGYANGHFLPERAPVPFASRDRHGLFTHDFESGTSKLALSVEEIKEMIGDPRLDRWDREQKEKTGDLTTLMAYCLRWSPDGKKCLFHFGNHCVDKRRGEPKIMYILTADADLTHVRVALDLCGERTGVHWSFEPNGEKLIGYGWNPETPGERCLMEVNADGSGYHVLAANERGGGHPSMHPEKPYLLLTDRPNGIPSETVIYDSRTGEKLWQLHTPENEGNVIPGRNPSHVDNHPVFSRDGKSVFLNRMRDGNAELLRIELPQEVLAR